MSPSELERKALRLGALVETKIVREHGLIPMFVRADDYELPTAEDYAGAYCHRHLKGRTEEELGLPPMHVWRAWENTATDTAYYLAAMAHKYRCTGEAQDLAICRRTFGGLKCTYGLAAERGEQGRLCKPYGGVWSNQSSGDQTQCVTWGLAAYRELAPPEDLADYRRLIRDAAEYNMETEYIEPHGYFGWTKEMLWDAIFGDETRSKVHWSHAAIFVAQLLLAENCTVTIAHSRTKDLPGVVRRADLVIAAVGRPEMVKGDWLKPGATVIDVGINRIERDGKGAYRVTATGEEISEERIEPRRLPHR